MNELCETLCFLRVFCVIAITQRSAKKTQNTQRIQEYSTSKKVLAKENYEQRVTVTNNEKFETGESYSFR